MIVLPDKSYSSKKEYTAIVPDGIAQEYDAVVIHAVNAACQLRPNPVSVSLAACTPLNHGRDIPRVSIQLVPILQDAYGRYRIYIIQKIRVLFIMFSVLPPIGMDAFSTNRAFRLCQGR